MASSIAHGARSFCLSIHRQVRVGLVGRVEEVPRHNWRACWFACDVTYPTSTRPDHRVIPLLSPNYNWVWLDLIRGCLGRLISPWTRIPQDTGATSRHTFDFKLLCTAMLVLSCQAGPCASDLFRPGWLVPLGMCVVARHQSLLAWHLLGPLAWLIPGTWSIRQSWDGLVQTLWVYN